MSKLREAAIAALELVHEKMSAAYNNGVSVFRD